MITKQQALNEYKSSQALAKALGVTPGRISQLKDNDPLPERLMLKLKYELKPEIFNKSKK